MTAATERIDPAWGLGERAMLEAFVDYHRATAVTKVLGLSEAQARTPLVATSPLLTPLGVLRHLVGVERSWFARRLGGLDVAPLWTEEDPDADWRPGPGETVASVVALYEAECVRSREVVGGLGLDDVAAHWTQPATVRWILTHLIEETARHNGHLDLLRESLDGTVGE